MFSALFRKAILLYEDYLWTLTFADKRVQFWPLMSSPVYTFILVSLYLLFVIVAPTVISKLEHPIRLRPIVILYNLSMLLLNMYIVVELIVVSIKANYNYICQPVNYSTDLNELRIAAALWWFYFSKLLEFADTVFFILRKKFSHVSFLHVYHHATMPCFWWIGIKWVAGGSAFLGAAINSFVHVCMYFYYLLTSSMPGYQCSWKKYLTVLQMSQFLIAIVHTIYGLYIECPFPRWMGYTLIGYATSLFILFGNFWLHAYRRKPSMQVCNESHAYDDLNGYHYALKKHL